MAYKSGQKNKYIKSVIIVHTLCFEMFMGHAVQQPGDLVLVFGSKNEVSTEIPHCCQVVT